VFDATSSAIPKFRGILEELLALIRVQILSIASDCSINNALKEKKKGRGRGKGEVRSLGQARKRAKPAVQSESDFLPGFWSDTTSSSSYQLRPRRRFASPSRCDDNDSDRQISGYL